MTWATLSSLIVTKLGTIAGVPSGNVFDFEPSGFSTYPAITVTPSDNTADFADTSRNFVRYTFMIRCYQERLELTPQVAESRMRALVDNIMTAFNADPTLGAALTSGYAKPIPSVWGYRSGPQVDERVAEIRYLTWFAQ